MKKKNLVKKLNLPKGTAQILFFICLISFLSPYLSGYDFGVIKIPPFSSNIISVFKFTAPFIFLVFIFLLIPVWTGKLESKESGKDALDTGKTEFSETKNDKLTCADINDSDSNINGYRDDKKNNTCILKRDVKSEDIIYAKTDNSTYKIIPAKNGYYRVTGGWFNRGGRSGCEVKIIGCVNSADGRFSKGKVYKDYVVSCNMCIKYGNGLITSPVKKITLRKINKD